MYDQQSPEMPTEAEPSDAAIVEQPRLGIIHLMLWTAGTAVLLSIVPYLRRSEMFGVSGDDANANTVFLGLWAIVNGPAVASWAIFFWRRRQNTPFPTQPGEWLLLLFGFEALCGSFSWLSVVVMEDWFESMGMLFFVPLLLAQLAAAIPYVVAARRARHSRAWRVFFVVLASASVLEVMRLLGYLPVWSLVYPIISIIGLGMYVLYAVATVSLLIAITHDRRRHVRRGWLHMTGVIVCVARAVTFGIAWLLWL